MKTYPLPSIFQAGHNNRTILHRSRISTFILHHEIDRQAELSAAMSRNSLAERAIHDLRIVDYARSIVPPAHKPLILPSCAVDVLGKDLHHVLFGVGRRVRATMAILRNIQGPIVVQEPENIVARWGVDDRRCYDLVHCLVVLGFRRIMDEAGTADVDPTGEECHAEGLVMGNPLKSSDEVGPLQVLD